MTINKEIIEQNQGLSSYPIRMKVVDGIVQNLPEIVGAIKEIYSLHKKGNAFNDIIRFKIQEMNIDSENFKVLVSSLTELSKDQNADNDTKNMYREMIKELFALFITNRKNSVAVSSFLDKW